LGGLVVWFFLLFGEEGINKILAFVCCWDDLDIVLERAGGALFIRVDERMVVTRMIGKKII